MKLPQINSWPKAPLLFPGLIFLLVNTSTSYHFYHVNSYKIVLVILGTTVFFLRNTPFFPSGVNDEVPWKIWFLLALPLLATAPGLFLHRFGYNYNFRYALATHMVLMLWSIYLFRSVAHETDFSLFLFSVGLVVIYNGCWSVLEKTGFHPLAWNEPVKMAKATFGHRNYFSGFLIVILPLLFVFAMPDIRSGNDPGSNPARLQSRMVPFYMLAFLSGCLGLLLAQTRAAIAAFGISMALVCFLYVRFFASAKWRKRIPVIYAAFLALGVCIIIVILANPDLFSEYRFAQLLTIKAWLGRRLAWETAIRSIMASPLVGYGLGSSYNLFFSFVDPDARLFHPEHSFNHAHSEILEYIQEAGLIGLVVYIVFWAWLIRLLVRMLKNPETNTTCIKLGIGICGGFLAYHIHGSFSVAPRMMVMKLPLYSLIAMTLILDRLLKPDRQNNDRQPTLKSRAISGLPTLSVLVVIWIVFLPWATGQWHFFRIRQERPAYLQIRKLKALTDLTPDIYALDHLARRQIEYKQIGGLKQTLDTIDRVIPYYRNVGYKKSLHAAMSRNPEQAKQLGLESQQRDRYNQPTIDLLLHLAVKTNDFPLFKEQFSLSLRKHAFSHRLVKSLDAEDVRILLVPGEDPLKVISNQDTLTFQWSEKLVGLLFKTARKNLKAGQLTATEKAQYQRFFRQLIARQHWFQLSIQEPFESERVLLLENAKAYHTLDREWEARKINLEQGYRRELLRIPSARKRTVYSRQQAELARIQQGYIDRQKAYEKILEAKTDWEFYKRKLKFIEAFTRRLMITLFPADA